MTILGASALIAATVAWAKGFRHSSSSFAPDNQIVHPENGRHDSQTGSADPEGTIRVFLRGIVFTVLPSLLFGLFNNSFLATDIYQRTMTPIANMANPLEEDERSRFYPGEAKIKGAMAKDSMLLDYISLDIISCVAAAVSNGNYKTVWGLLLATVCNSAYIVAGRIFAFVETPSPAGGVYYVVTIQERNFVAAFGIMIFYIISLWILRPHGVVRTCRRLFTLMDLASLVHQSHILQCPEFWLQSPSDTEDHLRAQVTLANRVYTYGVYRGYDDNEHIGIAPHSIPHAWDRSAGASLPNIYYSVELARDMLQYGLCGDDALKYAQDLLETRPGTEDGCVRVRSNEYRSWRKGYRRPRGPRGNTRSRETETSTTSSYQPPRPDPWSGSYQQISHIKTPTMGAETGRTEVRDGGEGDMDRRSP